jgi:rRNA-processing protein FCF1
MSDAAPECSCVIDTEGLRALVTASANLRAILLEQMKIGVIAVPTCVWNEFKDLYEEDAADIAPNVTNKINLNIAYRSGAARLADKMNSGLPRGPYDEQTDLYTASIASIEGYVVLTSSAHISEYDGLDCDVSDLESWAEEFD